MDILEQLKADYARFPENQSYDLYAPDVYFKDPMTQFRGIGQYQKMIGFIQTYFQAVKMDLHEMSRTDQTIHTRWTLNWKAPLPWHPQLSISGQSELILNEAGLIASHVDTWDCSRWSVFKQLFS